MVRSNLCCVLGILSFRGPQKTQTRSIREWLECFGKVLRSPSWTIIHSGARLVNVFCTESRAAAKSYWRPQDKGNCLLQVGSIMAAGIWHSFEALVS